MSALGRRHYSEEKSAEVKEEAPKADDTAISPELEKLKAKEAEVADLTVGLEFSFLAQCH